MATEIDFNVMTSMNDRAMIFRTEPVNISGFLEEIRLPVTIEYIQQKFGGGEYRVSLRDLSNRRGLIRASKTIKVGGPQQTKVDIIDQMTPGERVKTIREMGRRLRKYVPEAADYMESYDEK